MKIEFKKAMPKVGANQHELSMVSDIIQRSYNEEQMKELWHRLGRRIHCKVPF